MDIPLTIAGVDGNARDGEFGWFLPETYTDEAQIEEMLASGYMNFDNVKAGVQLDFRLVPWAGILEEENPSEYNIVVDSLQLYSNTDGEVTYLPDDETPNLPAETPRPEPTDAPEGDRAACSRARTPGRNATAAVTAGATSSDQTGEEPANNNIWIIAAVAAVVVIAVIVIAVVAAKKKKKPSDKE